MTDKIEQPNEAVLKEKIACIVCELKFMDESCDEVVVTTSQVCKRALLVTDKVLALCHSAIRQAYEEGRLYGQEEGRNDRNLANHNQAVEAAWRKSDYQIEQVLGKALGYPWYKDDQKNFPGATEANGVCVGDQVPETLAIEAAKKITQAEAECQKRVEAARIEERKRIVNLPNPYKLDLPFTKANNKAWLGFERCRELLLGQLPKA